MTSKKSKAIRTAADARAWIAENRPHVAVNDNDTVTLQRVCSRCGGSGRYSFNLMYGDRCFGCMNSRSRWTETIPAIAYAQAEKRNEANRARAEKRRAEKAEARLERQRDLNEEQGHGRLTFSELRAKRQKEREAEREAKRGIAPTGRVEFTGRVIKAAWYPSGYGEQLKATVVVTAEDGTEWLAFGTVPAAVRGQGFGKGAVIKIAATLEHGRDAHFAFWKRPRGEVIEPAPQNANEEDYD